jgi:uncharacterized protein (TIGR02246 family)
MIIASALLVSISSCAQASLPQDERGIRALQEQQAKAWNAHDIGAYANLFMPEAHVVNVLGWHWTSRAELKQKLGKAFGSVFAKSRMTIGEVTVEFLKPDIAVAHVRWTMSGALSPAGPESKPPEQGIQTQVLVKHGGVWKIADVQNTNSIPERAFPPR